MTGVEEYEHLSSARKVHHTWSGKHGILLQTDYTANDRFREYSDKKCERIGDRQVQVGRIQLHFNAAETSTVGGVESIILTTCSKHTARRFEG